MTTLARPAPSPAQVVRGGRLARRRRHRLALLVVSGLLLGVVVLALSLGDVPLRLADLVPALLGRGDGAAEFVLLRLRLPRVSIGALVGAGFGVAGAAFQTVLRNPLASPDILGIAAGASAAAVTAILLLGWDGLAVSAAALAGALGVAGLIAALAWRRGLAGQRFILVGIAIAMLVQAALGYLLTRADVRDVTQALVWMVGSTASARWSEIAAVAIAYLVLLPALAVASRPLPLLQLGDEAALGLGVRVDRQRVVVLTLAVALVAVGTAVVGPIAFVAFVAGPIARRVLGTGGPASALAGVVGALVVVAADVAAQHLVPGTRVPVGIVTALVGAPYLLWLLGGARRAAGDAR
jgi:iron complex transport system permease protein